jgi:hypothetical protein
MSTEENKKPVFDLSAIDTVKDANQGAEVELYHPTNGQDLGIRVRVLGKDSDKFRQVHAAQGRKRTAKLQKTGFRGGVSAADIEQEGIELLANCTIGWSGMVMGGKEVPFSTDNAIAIYTQYPWIKEQIDSAIADRALFTKA